MKTRLRFASPNTLLLVSTILALNPAHSAPPSPKAFGTALPERTNSVPQSVFHLPSDGTPGRDPFFPNVNRLKRSTTSSSSSSKPSVTLLYNGLSGTSDRQLAMINGKTMAEGDEIEISSNNTRVKVRCIGIKGETVVVEVGGERQELHLSGSK